MRTALEIMAQIHAVERDLKVMGPTPAKLAWEYYLKALKWVIGEDLRLIGSFEIADEKNGVDSEHKQSMSQDRSG